MAEIFDQIGPLKAPPPHDPPVGHLKIRKSPQKVRKVLISLGKLIECARIHIWVDKIAHFSEKHDFSPFFYTFL